MLPRIFNGVCGLAFNDKGQVLLTQRNQPEYPEIHMKWQLPGGGQEFGEHPLDTLKREMMEETGVNCELLDERPLVYISLWHEDTPKAEHINLLVYLISIGDQTPTIADEETNDYQWVDVTKVKDYPQLPNLTKIVLEGHKVWLGLEHNR